MTDRPQRWALEATGTWRPGDTPTEAKIEEALAIQRAAAPLLAVVEACDDHVNGDWSDDTRRALIGRLVDLIPEARKAMRTEP